MALTIHDVSGRIVRRLDLGWRNSGYCLGRGSAAYWDGRNADGEGAGSGVYLYRLDAGAVSATRRMVLRK